MCPSPSISAIDCKPSAAAELTLPRQPTGRGCECRCQPGEELEFAVRQVIVNPVGQCSPVSTARTTSITGVVRLFVTVLICKPWLRPSLEGQANVAGDQVNHLSSTAETYRLSSMCPAPGTTVALNPRSPASFVTLAGLLCQSCSPT